MFVQLELHATLASGGTGLGAGRSSAAEGAAKAMTARTSSSLTDGNSLTMASVVAPCARFAR
jgi:hypothetical protein